MKIDVKQKPGLSYPKPVDHVHIVEQSYVPPIKFHQPFADKHHNVGHLGGAGAACPVCGGDCGGHMSGRTTVTSRCGSAKQV